jgi:hypothetical protein
MKKNNNKLLAAAAYVFFVPALYIILSDARRDDFLSYHASRAFYVWVLEAAGLLGLRLGLMVLYNSFRFVPPFDVMFAPYLLLMFANVAIAVLLLFNYSPTLPFVSDWTESMIYK